jgi:PAS domain S-box-containing protein
MTKIMIVDDEQDTQLMFTMGARKVHPDWEFVHITNPTQALPTLQAQPDISCVILDMVMPEMSGLEVLQVIHGLLPRLPVIIVTCYGDMAIIRQAMQLGAYDFVIKPFREMGDVFGSVERAILDYQHYQALMQEQRRLETILQQERRMLRTLIDAMPDVICITDIHGHFLLVNRAGQQFYGMAEETLISHHRESDYLPPQLLQEVLAEDRHVVQGESMLEKEELVISPVNSIESWMLTTKVPLYNQQGAVSGIIIVRRDISDIRATLREAEKTRDLLHEVVKVIHHGVKETNAIKRDTDRYTVPR